MNPQVIEEYLICSEGMKELYPLRHADTVVHVRAVEKLDAHRKLLLLSGFWLVVDHFEVVGGIIAGLFNQRHRGWYFVLVSLG